MPVTVSAIYISPVVSCRAISVQVNVKVSVAEWGFEYDRRWMVVDENGAGLSQKEASKLVLIEQRITDNRLELRVPDGSIFLPLAGVKGKWVEVTRGKERYAARDQGGEMGQFMSAFLEKKCSVVFMPASQRYLRFSNALERQVRTSFSWYPFLGISEASLEDINGRLPKPMTAAPFRPSILFADCEPYEEDEWSFIKIGSTILQFTKRCDRCAITTVDQITGIRESKEPLTALGKYRRAGNDVFFGSYFVPLSLGGDIAVGDTVETHKRVKG